MGFSVSSTHMVFFVASMLVASVVAGVVVKSTFSVRDGISTKQKEIEDNLKTDIEIINDPGNMPNDPLKVYVKNTGSTEINKSDVNLLINGTLYPSTNITIIDGGGYIWGPTEVISIEAGIELPPGDHWLKVIGSNRVNARFKFSI